MLLQFVLSLSLEKQFLLPWSLFFISLFLNRSLDYVRIHDWDQCTHLPGKSCNCKAYEWIFKPYLTNTRRISVLFCLMPTQEKTSYALNWRVTFTWVVLSWGDASHSIKSPGMLMALGHGDLQAEPAIVLPVMNEWGGGAALSAQEWADIVSAGSVEHLLIQWWSAKHFGQKRSR